MKDYQSLLKALVTVIVRYHLSIQGNTEGQEEDALVTRILEQPSLAGMNKALGQQVLNATNGEDGGLRKTLHEYLHFMAVSLKAHIDLPHYCQNNEQVPTFHQQSLQFFHQIQLLLNTHQNSTVEIQFNGKRTPVAGLKNGIFSASSICRSGKLLQDNIFTPLGLDCNSSQEKLNQAAFFLDKVQQADVLTQITGSLRGELEEAQDKLEKTEKKLSISQCQLEAMIKERHQSYSSGREPLTKEAELNKNVAFSKNHQNDTENRPASRQPLTNDSFWSTSPKHQVTVKLRLNNPLRFMVAAMEIFTKSLKAIAAQYEAQLKDDSKEAGEMTEKNSP